MTEIAKTAYEVARETLSELERTHSDIEGKAKVWLGLNSTMLISGALALTAKLPDTTTPTEKSWMLVLAAVLVGVLAASYICFLLALRPGQMQGRPTINSIEKRPDTMTVSGLYKQALASISESEQSYVKANKTKSRLLQIGTWISCGAFVVFMILILAVVSVRLA